MFFDPATHRVAKMSLRGLGMQGPADMDIVLGDFREVSGVYLPFSEVIFQNGQKFSERTYSERKVNPELGAERFQKP
jgi:hypothetical protein